MNLDRFNLFRKTKDKIYRLMRPKNEVPTEQSFDLSRLAKIRIHYLTKHYNKAVQEIEKKHPRLDYIPKEKSEAEELNLLQTKKDYKTLVRRLKDLTKRKMQNPIKTKSGVKTIEYVRQSAQKDLAKVNLKRKGIRDMFSTERGTMGNLNKAEFVAKKNRLEDIKDLEKFEKYVKGLEYETTSAYQHAMEELYKQNYLIALYNCGGDPDQSYCAAYPKLVRFIENAPADIVGKAYLLDRVYEIDYIYYYVNQCGRFEEILAAWERLDFRKVRQIITQSEWLRNYGEFKLTK